MCTTARARQTEAKNTSRSGSQLTRRWREPDSNQLSRSCERSLGCCRRGRRTDKLDRVIKRRSSRETTMVGRGASPHGHLFLGGTDGSNPVPSSGESANPRSLSRRTIRAAAHARNGLDRSGRIVRSNVLPNRLERHAIKPSPPRPNQGAPPGTRLHEQFQRCDPARMDRRRYVAWLRASFDR